MLEKIKTFFDNEINRKNFLIFICMPFGMNLLIEMFNRKSIIAGIAYMFVHPVPYWCNSLIIMVSLSIALVLKRRLFYLSLISFIWILFGFINMVMLSVRVTPFNASDLRLLETGKAIINQYFNVFTIVLVIVAIILVIGFIIFLYIKGRTVEYKINYFRNSMVIVAMFLICTVSLNLAVRSETLALKFTNLTNAYHEYGFVYCFGNGLVNTGIKKPTNYSQDKIDVILDEIETEVLEDLKDTPQQEQEEPAARPNIIFLQLESFFDINKVKDLVFSEDPIPYFNEMKKNFSSGFLDVFNVGYGTCNTEFEVMSGMNLDDFGPGEMPYKTILQKTTCETAAYNLKEYGYATHAFHNNDATFYERHKIFKNLGFDTFTSIEYMNVNEYTVMDWAKDKFLTEEIVNALQSTKNQPDYVYAISVQGHGSYPTTPGEIQPVVRVGEMEDAGRRNAIEYYANQIREMDNFLRELTAALSELDEEVVLVMYGDHLPGLGFSEDDLENASLYQTEYIIWNNMDLEVFHKDLQAYQLSAKVLSIFGMDAGVINKYHQMYQNDEEYLSNLQNLEYDMLYGDKIAYGGFNPYTPTAAKLGIDTVEITKIEMTMEGIEPCVLVYGKHFNEYSVVAVNGTFYDTKLVAENTLQIQYDDLKTLDSFVVSQMDIDDGTVLSSTKECLYYGQ